jgi:hypothetical protein
MPIRPWLFRSAVVSSFVLYAAASHAGIIATENAKTGVSPAGSFIALDDGTAAADGIVDVYMGEWSIKQGDSIHLKVRSTTGYDVSIFRLGWYGGAGATLVTQVSGSAADPQPYPTADATYGLAEAGWHVSNTIATDETWTPGVYAARIEQPSGKMGETIFVIRDDALTTKLPVLFVLSTATHEAYNAWPGPSRGGKSLYAFNCSSASVSSDTIVPPIQAVKVSFDRPFFVGGGTADLTRYEYPFVRWLEMKGSWDVAYANDQDLQANPSLVSGRKMIVIVGHAEYYSATMRNALVAARDAGTNLLFATGDTISWQVRFEAGAGGANNTMVGYKENYAKDPEYKIGAPDMTRPWKTVGHPAIELAGVESSGQIRDAYGAGKPDFAFDSKGAAALGWADLTVNFAAHWLFAGTGMISGDKIKYVMGYEVDSTLIGSTEFDPYRPPGQTVLGTITQDADGTRKGAVGYYKAASGAEVVGMSAIAWSWALDDYAEQQSSSPPPPSSIDAHAQQMMVNVFDRFTSATAPTDTDAGPPPDVGPDPDATSPDDSAIPDVPPPDGFDAAFDVTPSDASGTDTTNPADSTGGDATLADSSGPSDTSSGGVDSSFGDAGPTTDAGGSVSEQGSSSCSCDVPGSSASSSFDAIAIAAAAIGLVASRRRKR